MSHAAPINVPACKVALMERTDAVVFDLELDSGARIFAGMDRDSSVIMLANLARAVMMVHGYGALVLAIEPVCRDLKEHHAILCWADQMAQARYVDGSADRGSADAQGGTPA